MVWEYVVEIIQLPEEFTLFKITPEPLTVYLLFSQDRLTRCAANVLTAAARSDRWSELFITDYAGSHSGILSQSGGRFFKESDDFVHLLGVGQLLTGRFPNVATDIEYEDFVGQFYLFHV